MLEQQAAWVLFLAFAAGAAVIWVGGSSAARRARMLADRLELGEAFVGLATA